MAHQSKNHVVSRGQTSLAPLNIFQQVWVGLKMWIHDIKDHRNVSYLILGYLLILWLWLGFAFAILVAITLTFLNYHWKNSSLLILFIVTCVAIGIASALDSTFWSRFLASTGFALLLAILILEIASLSPKYEKTSANKTE